MQPWQLDVSRIFVWEKLLAEIDQSFDRSILLQWFDASSYSLFVDKIGSVQISSYQMTCKKCLSRQKDLQVLDSEDYQALGHCWALWSEFLLSFHSPWYNLPVEQHFYCFHPQLASQFQVCPFWLEIRLKLCKIYRSYTLVGRFFSKNATTLDVIFRLKGVT